MSNGIVIPINEPNFRGTHGIVSFISWQRLEETLRNAGEICDSEELEGVTVNERGFTYYVRKKA